MAVTELEAAEAEADRLRGLYDDVRALNVRLLMAALEDINVMNRAAQRAIMMLAADNKIGAVAVLDEALNAPSRLSSVATVSLALAGLSVQAKPPSPSPQEPPRTCE